MLIICKLLVTWILIWKCCAISALEISHLDLEVANRTCGIGSSCMISEVIPKDENGTTINDNERNCMCDQKCAQHGDCCVDSPFFNIIQQRRATALFDCPPIPENEVYMRRNCPSVWTNTDIRKKCELSSKNNTLDPLLSTPVTIARTLNTYGNVYCAICHGDHLGFEYWKTTLICPTVPKDADINEHNMSDHLYFNNKTGFWQLAFDMMYHNCSIQPSVPNTLKSRVRPCISNMVKTCISSWTNVDIRRRCEAYTSVVYSSETAYRNTHCAICNNIPVQNLSCKKAIIQTRFEVPTPFSILFDFKGGKTVGKKQPCNDDQLYDPFFKICRDIVFDEVESIPSSEIDRGVRTPDDNLNSQEIKPNLVNRENQANNPRKRCSKFVLGQTDYVAINESVIYVPAYGRTFSTDKYSINEDGSAFVCADSIIGKKLISKYRPYLGILTLVGIGISIICLCVHLTAFIFVYELRNLSGMNLASFSVALLLGYISFLLGDAVTGKMCFINAIVTYYLFLAAFFWMTTIAFDVWRALRLATSELRISSGKQYKKFLIYSIFSWLAPISVVLLATAVELSPKGYIPENYKPNFGTVSCWFGQGEALLIFLGIPLGVIMLSNIAFFTSSSCMIYSSQSMTVYSASADTLRNFKLYSRLAVIMGLTWITGLIAGFIDNEIFWLIFILLNTTQGLFVFIAFTCRKRVIRAFIKMNNDGNSLHLPRCSWSGASYNTNAPDSRKQSVKTTSTTYY